MSEYTGIGNSSTVDQLASTRKELKHLIKIQSKHAKLLQKLQQKGVIKDQAGFGDNQVSFTLLN